MGKSVKPGPKPINGETMKRRSVNLTDEQWEWCCIIGGKQGAGAVIRWLIDAEMNNGIPPCPHCGTVGTYFGKCNGCDFNITHWLFTRRQEAQE